MRTSTSVFICLPLVTAAGCGVLRSDFIPATGEPLRVVDRTMLRTGTQTVATGQDEIRDSTGRLMATSTHFENQQIAWEEREWFPLQGDARIDDESFYRIANEQAAIRKYDEYHRSGRTRSIIGIALGTVSVGLIGGGLGMLMADAPKKNPITMMDSETTSLSTAGYATLVAGIVGIAAIGIPLWLGGRRAASAHDVRLFDEPERMKSLARRYNLRLMVQPVPAASSQGYPLGVPAPEQP